MLLLGLILFVVDLIATAVATFFAFLGFCLFSGLIGVAGAVVAFFALCLHKPKPEGGKIRKFHTIRFDRYKKFFNRNDKNDAVEAQVITEEHYTMTKPTEIDEGE